MKKNPLIQLIQANLTKPKTFEVKAESDADEATIYLYDAIDPWWGVDAQSFVTALQGIEASTIHLRVNSPGGDVFEARAIKTALEQHKASVKVHIDGLAASAATFIAMAGDEIEMAQGSFFMIHQAWSIAMGNANDFRDTANLLEKIDSQIVNDYAKRTKQDTEQLANWMQAETWFTADEAKEHGFVDSVFEAEKPSNVIYDLSAYKNAPKMEAKPEPKGPDRERLAARLKLFFPKENLGA